MSPAPGEAAAGGDGLGPLVLVMGEGQVQAAAVEVEARHPAGPGPSRRTRCASPGGPDPRASPSWAHPPWRSSRGRSRSGSACPPPRPPPPGRPPASSPGAGGPAGHNRRCSRPRSTRRHRRHRRGPVAIRSAIRSIMSLHVGGGVRDVGRPLDAQPGHGVPPHLLVLGCHLLGRPALPAPARAMILSSMSVTLETKRTSSPRPGQVPAQHVPRHVEAAVAEVGLVVHRRPAHVHRHPPGIAELERVRSTPNAVSCRRSTPVP